MGITCACYHAGDQPAGTVANGEEALDGTEQGGTSMPDNLIAGDVSMLSTAS